MGQSEGEWRGVERSRWACGHVCLHLCVSRKTRHNRDKERVNIGACCPSRALISMLLLLLYATLTLPSPPSTPKPCLSCHAIKAKIHLSKIKLNKEGKTTLH